MCHISTIAQSTLLDHEQNINYTLQNEHKKAEISQISHKKGRSHNLTDVLTIFKTSQESSSQVFLAMATNVLPPVTTFPLALKTR